MASRAACEPMTLGKSSLPPKAPPVSVWMTRHFSCGQVEDERERVDEVVRALHGAGDGDGLECAVGGAEGFGDDAVVFDVELFLSSRSVFALDNEVGGGEGGLALGGRGVLHEEGLEGVGGVVFRVVAVPDDFGLRLRLRLASESSMVKTPGSSS